MCIVKNTEYTPPVQFSNARSTNFRLWLLPIASLLDPERAYRSIVWQSRDYTQHFPKYSNTTTPPPPPKVQCAIYSSGKRPQSQRKGFKVSICPFRDPFVWPQIRESKSNRLEHSCGYLSCFTSAVFSPPIPCNFYLFHLIWLVELVILGGRAECRWKQLFLIKNSNKNNLWKKKK